MQTESAAHETPLHQPHDESSPEPTGAPAAGPAATEGTGADQQVEPVVADPVAGQPAAVDAASGEDAEPDAQSHSFGDPRVDEAVARTQGLDQLPVESHAAVFEQVHEAFADALSDAGSTVPAPEGEHRSE